MRRADIADKLREFLDYGPRPATVAGDAAYNHAEELLEMGASDADLLDVLEDMLTESKEPRSHFQHMLKDSARKLVRNARPL